MDGTFGISVDWRGNVYDAAKAVALKCLATRSKYGSLSGPEYANWRERRLAALAAQESEKAVAQ